MAEPNANGSSALSAPSIASDPSRGLKRPLNAGTVTRYNFANALFEFKTYNFAIDNVTRLLDGNGVTVFSNMYPISETRDFKVQLSFDPNPPAEKKAGYAEITLHLNDSLNDSLRGSKQFKVLSVEHKIAILDSKGDEKFFKEGHQRLNCQNIQSEIIFWEDPTLCIAKTTLLDEKYSLIKNNQLEISFSIRLEYDLVRESQSQVCRDLSKLLDNGKFSDVTIIVKGKQFQAHKAILCARSQVFAAMFEVDCIEKKENKTEIDDIEPNIFQELLNYIYFGKVDIGLQTAADIFEAADKYEIMDLKCICEKFLSSNLEMEVVPQVLQLADMHQSDDLKQACIEFLSDNSEDIDVTTWSVLQNHPDITFRLFCDVSSKKSKKEEPQTPATSQCRSTLNAQNQLPPGRNGANQHHRPNVDPNANRPAQQFLLQALHQPPPVAHNNRAQFNPFLDEFLNAGNVPLNINANHGIHRFFNYFRHAPARQYGNPPAVAVVAGGNDNVNPGANVNPAENGNADGNAGGNEGNVNPNNFFPLVNLAAVNQDPNAANANENFPRLDPL